MAAAAESLQSNVELVLGAGVGLLTDDQRRLLETGWRNGRRLLGLIGDLHTVALVEAGRYEVEWTTVDLLELATCAAEAAWPVAHATGKELRIDATGPTHSIAAEEVLGRALEALLDHAVEHARRGAEIVVAVGEATVAISFPAAERIFADELPVALAQAVARLHGGDVVAGLERGTATLALNLGVPGDADETA